MVVALLLWWRNAIAWHYWSLRVITMNCDPRKAPTWYLRTVVDEWDEWVDAGVQYELDTDEFNDLRSQLSACRQEFRRRTGFYGSGRV